MDYFVMMPDERVDLYRRVNSSDAGFQGEEPFVTYLEFDSDERLPNYFQGRGPDGRFCFCVSSDMKEILDAYGCLEKAAPFFLTDVKHRAQRVYWNIGVREEDCLRQELFADRSSLSFRRPPDPRIHLFCAAHIKKQYMIVTLELAEHLLRAQMFGLKFFPVRTNEEAIK